MGIFGRRRKEKEAKEPDISQLTPTELLIKGAELYNAKDYQGAFEYFLKGAEQDDITCISNVAMCICADLVDQYKPSDCIVWVKKLKALGHGDMEINWYKNKETGNFYTVNGFLDYLEDLGHKTMTPEQKYQQGRNHDDFSGFGVYNTAEPDRQKAFTWYKEAAQDGHLCAQNLVGLCYHCGYGVELDYGEAVYWHAKAAFNKNYDEETADKETRQNREAARKNLLSLRKKISNFDTALRIFAPEDANEFIQYAKEQEALEAALNDDAFQAYFNETMDRIRKDW